MSGKEGSNVSPLTVRSDIADEDAAKPQTASHAERSTVLQYSSIDGTVELMLKDEQQDQKERKKDIEKEDLKDGQKEDLKDGKKEDQKDKKEDQKFDKKEDPRDGKKEDPRDGKKKDPKDTDKEYQKDRMKRDPKDGEKEDLKDQNKENLKDRGKRDPRKFRKKEDQKRGQKDGKKEREVEKKSSRTYRLASGLKENRGSYPTEEAAISDTVAISYQGQPASGRAKSGRHVLRDISQTTARRSGFEIQTTDTIPAGQNGETETGLPGLFQAESRPKQDRTGKGKIAFREPLQLRLPEDPNGFNIYHTPTDNELKADEQSEPVNQDYRQNKPVGQRDLELNEPVSQRDLELIGPVNQRDLELTGPVNQRDLELTGPVSQRDLELIGPVNQRDLELNRPVSQRDLELNRPIRQRILKLGGPGSQGDVEASAKSPSRPTQQGRSAGSQKYLQLPLADDPDKRVLIPLYSANLPFQHATKKNRTIRNTSTWRALPAWKSLATVDTSSDVDHYHSDDLSFIHTFIEFSANVHLAVADFIFGKTLVNCVDIFIAMVIRAAKWVMDWRAFRWQRPTNSWLLRNPCPGRCLTWMASRCANTTGKILGWMCTKLSLSAKQDRHIPTQVYMEQGMLMSFYPFRFHVVYLQEEAVRNLRLLMSERSQQHTQKSNTEKARIKVKGVTQRGHQDRNDSFSPGNYSGRDGGDRGRGEGSDDDAEDQGEGWRQGGQGDGTNEFEQRTGKRKTDERSNENDKEESRRGSKEIRESCRERTASYEDTGRKQEDGRRHSCSSTRQQDSDDAHDEEEQADAADSSEDEYTYVVGEYEDPTTPIRSPLAERAVFVFSPRKMAARTPTSTNDDSAEGRDGLSQQIFPEYVRLASPLACKMLAESSYESGHEYSDVYLDDTWEERSDNDASCKSVTKRRVTQNMDTFRRLNISVSDEVRKVTVKDKSEGGVRFPSPQVKVTRQKESQDKGGQSMTHRKITPVKRRLRGKEKGISSTPLRLHRPPSPLYRRQFGDLSLGQQFLCLLSKLPYMWDIIRNPLEPPALSFRGDAPVLIADHNHLQSVGMAPTSAPSGRRMKRKLSTLFSEDDSDNDPEYVPSEMDTTDPLEYSEGDAEGVSDLESEAMSLLHITEAEVEVHQEDRRTSLLNDLQDRADDCLPSGCSVSPGRHDFAADINDVMFSSHDSDKENNGNDLFQETLQMQTEGPAPHPC